MTLWTVTFQSCTVVSRIHLCRRGRGLVHSSVAGCFTQGFP
jgi:hypothetical protein